jgi:hypothetical protein
MIEIIHVVQRNATDREIHQLEKALESTKVAFENESEDKIERRKQLLRQLFKVVRQEAMMMRGEIGLSPPNSNVPSEAHQISR